MMGGHIPPPPRWDKKGPDAGHPFRGCLGLCIAIIFSAVIIFVLVVLLRHAYQ
jgi:hypothetical protein